MLYNGSEPLLRIEELLSFSLQDPFVTAPTSPVITTLITFRRDLLVDLESKRQMSRERSRSGTDGKNNAAGKKQGITGMQDCAFALELFHFKIFIGRTLVKLLAKHGVLCSWCPPPPLLCRRATPSTIDLQNNHIGRARPGRPVQELRCRDAPFLHPPKLSLRSRFFLSVGCCSF